MALKIRRGLEVNRISVTPAEGEFLYTTDEKKLYIGDGTTAGGTLVSGVGGSETAASILAKLLTVDGAGSGLDADTLDGFSSSDFAAAAHSHAASAITNTPAGTVTATDVQGAINELATEKLAVVRDTSANFTSGNPVLAAGQLGTESDTGRGKFGDGATAWNSLLYHIVPIHVGPTPPASPYLNQLWVDTA